VDRAPEIIGDHEAETGGLACSGEDDGHACLDGCEKPCVAYTYDQLARIATVERPAGRHGAAAEAVRR
jgi:NADPH-dependent glutamate synthase beta subunit-like oxidoreductase